jgi:hypothetical protein
VGPKEGECCSRRFANYCADIAIIHCSTSHDFHKYKKNRKPKKKGGDKTTEQKASQKQTEKSKNGNNPNSFSELFAQTETVKRELHRLPLLCLVSVRPDEFGCFDWRNFAKNHSYLKLFLFLLKGNPNKKKLNKFA